MCGGISSDRGVVVGCGAALGPAADPTEEERDGLKGNE
jgi:hypothetical protein